MELEYEFCNFKAIDGLDDAIIGVATTPENDREVLAYDLELAINILSEKNYSRAQVEQWIENVQTKAGEPNQPVFIYRDHNVREQVKRDREYRRTLN
tara:strand:+ start:770 stop:1060 length:291 start_codon:yes stop_codon:yes gene_type:complete